MDTIEKNTVETLSATRRALHGIAEGLLAGPQHRTCGGLALRVTATGFATTGDPALRLDRDSIVVDELRRVPVDGTFAEVGAATGWAFGEPVEIYSDHSGVGGDETIMLDEAARDLLISWYVAADAALRVFLPDSTPRLWPEHFDVAIDVGPTTYGASPGDGFCPTPYVYLSTRAVGDDPFWNAPFGAYLGYEQVPPLAELVDFWRRGQSLLG